jgi:hypothetical protein
MSCLPAVESRIRVAGVGFTSVAASAPRTPDPTGRLERLPLLTQLGVHAALQAKGETALDDETALIVATGHGPIDSMAEFVGGFRARGHARGNPFLFPNVLYNAVAGEIAIRAGLRGPNVTMTNGDLCGAGCLEVGLLLLRSGRARRVLIVSVEHGGALIEHAYARLQRRGLGRSRPLSHGRPPAEDTASALLLDPEARGPLGVVRAVTGYVRTDAAFAAFVARASEKLDVARALQLPGDGPASLGRFVAAAQALDGPGCSLFVHRAEDGGCAAVAFEI